MNTVNRDTQAVVNTFTVPFISEGDVPLNFIPICPTATQLSSCDSSIVNISSDDLIVTNLTAQAAFEVLDHPSYNNTNFTQLELENEIYGNGKIYFLCRLMTYIQRNRHLTDVQVAILTENPIIEKIMYFIFRFYFYYETVRVSHIPQPRRNHFGGYSYGVILRLMSTQKLPINLDDTDIIFTFDGDVFPQRWDNLKSFLGHESNPYILNMCSIGSPDLRLKSYLSLSDSYQVCSREILIFHHNEHMKDLFYGSNERYSGLEFLVWNDKMAQQVVEWLFSYDPSDQYQFKYPIVSRNPLLNE